MLLILVVVAPLIVIAAGIVAGRAGGPAARRWADWLRWAAFATAAVAAVMLAPAVVRDSGWFATVLLGVPVVLAALPVGLNRITGRCWSGIDWLAAILAMAWAVLLALGIGVAFLPAALLQFAAAATATASGRTAGLGPDK
jgi:hypothetical protein